MARLSIEERFESKVLKTTSCWEWQKAKTIEGYGLMWSTLGTKLAHRISYILHVGPIPVGLLVCHSCDNPSCVNPAHLWLGTDKQNQEDRTLKNRGACKVGSKNPNVKLTPQDVEAIRHDDRVLREIAKDYGVGTSQVWRIQKGTSWPVPV